MLKQPRNSTIERGVVLHTTKFGDRQMVVHLITEHRSRMSFITSLGGRKGAARRIFAPLSLIEFSATYGSGDLGKMSGASPCPALFDISSDIVKCTVALFMSELLYRVVRGEGESEGELYEFVRRSVVELDALSDRTATANYHLYFMVHLSAHLGYAPRANWGEGCWFDIKLGEFCSAVPVGHSLYMEPRAAEILYRLLACQDGQTGDLQLSGADRSRFLLSMVDYYAWHTDAIHSVRSITILSEIFA